MKKNTPWRESYQSGLSNKASSASLPCGLAVSAWAAKKPLDIVICPDNLRDQGINIRMDVAVYTKRFYHRSELEKAR